jgi:DNA-binding transcriptional LysR family regulator
MRLYASPEYIAKHGMPERIEDISKHRLICQNPRSAQVASGLALVQRLMTYNVSSMLTVNNYFGVLQSVIHGLGIGMLPDYSAQDLRSVIRVLPDVESVEVPVYLAYPEELRQSKRIAAFRDFVEAEILATRRKQRDQDA